MSEQLRRRTRQTDAVIAVLAADPDRDWWGFDLAKYAGVRTGTIYPVLARLERLDWLESRWQEPDSNRVGRPQRRLYRLTKRGRDAVAEYTRASESRALWSLREQPA